MLKAVKLANFRGFEKLDLDLKPVSVVIGPNSSGKTSVLHAISAAHRAYALALDAADAHPTLGDRGPTVVCNGSIVRDHAKLLPLAVQEEIFRDGVATEGATTRIELGFDKSDPIQRLIVQLSYMRNRVLKLTVEVDCPAAMSAVRGLPLKSKYRPGKLLDALRRDRPVAVVVPAFYGVTLEEGFLAAPLGRREASGGATERNRQEPRRASLRHGPRGAQRVPISHGWRAHRVSDGRCRR